MKILVCIKQVPDTTDVKLDPKTGALIREGTAAVLNPDDRHAVEAALGLKKTDTTTVTAISMGPPQAVDVLTEAIGMGADAGVLLSDKAFAGADTWATAFTLGKAVQKCRDFSLVICGRQAVDGDTAQIGPQLADFLGIPQITAVCGIESMDADRIVARQVIDGGRRRLETPLPALITVVGEVNRPRYPDVGRLIDACRDHRSIRIWNAADIGVTVDQVGLAGSLTEVVKTEAPSFKREGVMIRGDARNAVESLFKHMRNSEAVTVCKAVADACRL